MNLTDIRTVAEQGQAEAQFNLGMTYHNGEGVPRNDSEATKWYRKAAEQGHAEAQYNVVSIYYFDGVIQQDYDEAVDLFYKEFEQKDATG